MLKFFTRKKSNAKLSNKHCHLCARLLKGSEKQIVTVDGKSTCYVCTQKEKMKGGE